MSAPYGTMHVKIIRYSDSGMMQRQCQWFLDDSCRCRTMKLLSQFIAAARHS